MDESQAGTIEHQVELLTAGAADVIRPSELADRLRTGRPLRVKFGIDPTASDIHLGHTVVLQRLRRFQDLGHTAVLIIGDFTARVGDPSGRSATRPRLSADEVDAHAATYIAQVARVLRPDRLELRRNSEWLATMGIDDVLRLASRATVARMLERDDFSRRHRDGVAISVMEFLYPLLQGWDSVMVEADVELGGTDQLFNLLMGRQLQEQEGQTPQVVLTTRLLEGLDGVHKMSKSLGNAVGIAEAPEEQFGKVMSIPDALMPTWFSLTTGWYPDQIAEVVDGLDTGSLAPVDAKRRLARTIVDLYHGDGAGVGAEEQFNQVFRRHEAPADVAEYVLDPAELHEGTVRLAKVLALAGLVPSNREGRRKIEQGGVRVNGDQIADPDLEFSADGLDGALVQVGRRAWARVRVHP